MNAESFRRLGQSKKSLLALIPIIAVGVLEGTGYDPTHILEAVVALFAFALIIAQTCLDLKHGSLSDSAALTRVFTALREEKEHIIALDREHATIAKKTKRSQGGHALSWALVGLVVLVSSGLYLTGCYTFDGAAYSRLAKVEQARSQVDPAACAAHAAAVIALESGEGNSKTWLLPLSSMARIHETEAERCAEVMRRKATEEGFSREAEDVIIRNWRSIWADGASTLGDR